MKCWQQSNHINMLQLHAPLSLRYF